LNNSTEEKPEQQIDEKFLDLADGTLLRVYQSIFDSVKAISSHLRYTTSKFLNNFTQVNVKIILLNS